MSGNAFTYNLFFIMAQHKLSIVIPAFKDYQKISHCLLELSRSRYTDFNIILVDHSVSKNISLWVGSDFPHVTCLPGSPDLWWSGAMNLGIKAALGCGSDLIMPLNHDCYVRKDTIEKLLNSFQDVSNVIIAPIQFNLVTRKELVCATSFFLFGFPTISFRGKWCRKFRTKKLLPTGLIIGGRGVLIHAKVFKSIGYFDEKNFPHYWADHDFYLRCKKSGVKLFTCMNATVDVDDDLRSLQQNGECSFDTGIIHSLVDRRSPRNIRDIYHLFSRHYPIPGLAIMGVMLYMMRYYLVYYIRKIIVNIKQ